MKLIVIYVFRCMIDKRFEFWYVLKILSGFRNFFKEWVWEIIVFVGGGWGGI